jgi:hypothetical protein
MKPGDPGHELFRRYLLGQFPDPSQQSLEERFMTGDTSLEELEASEDELIDDYLAGRLTDYERQAFEQHFLNHPTRQQKLRFAKVFHRYSATHPIQTIDSRPEFWSNAFSLRTWPARLAALAIVVIAAAGIWFYGRSRQVSQSYASITLSLSAGNRAVGVDSTQVTLPESAGSLRLTLLLPVDAEAVNYRVELENDSGEVIPTSLVEQKRGSLTIEVSGSQLQRRHYIVKVFAGNEQRVEQRISGGYFFSIK